MTYTWTIDDQGNPIKIELIEKALYIELQNQVESLKEKLNIAKQVLKYYSSGPNGIDAAEAIEAIKIIEKPTYNCHPITTDGTDEPW